MGSCWEDLHQAFGSYAEASPRPGIQSRQPRLHTSHTGQAMCGEQQNLKKNKESAANQKKLKIKN